MHITQFTLTVRDYDEAIAFYTRVLGFALLEDTDLGAGKRWVRVGSPSGPAILLARAATPEQLATVGNQTGGRVFVFMETDDLDRDYKALTARGVEFIRPPSQEPYGRVAVFRHLYGTKLDLIEPSRPGAPEPSSSRRLSSAAPSPAPPPSAP